jgi:NhaA family Na+:H+ antiporter
MLRVLLKIESRVNPGLLLLGAGIFALGWANLPKLNSAYFHLAEFTIPLGQLGLSELPDLTVEELVRDFLLAIFFFGIGLELKQEFTVGTLRSPKSAILPIMAACGGMLVPSLVYLAITLGSGNSGLISGFAIPTATDIAFSVGILALIGKKIHPAVRIFLLTLAVTDDILGIMVIAIGYSTSLNFVFLLFCLVTLLIFFGVVRIYHPISYLLGPILGLTAWYFMFASGIHPAISGVALGLCMSSKTSPTRTRSRAQIMLVGLSPISDLIVLPIFAFFQLGVPLGALTFDSNHLSLLNA